MSKGKVIFCVPSLEGPTGPFKRSLEASIKPVIDAGWEEGLIEERGNVYISNARATMLRKALDKEPDAVVFLDYDLGWEEGALLKLLETEGDMVAGTYRYKLEKEEYMGITIPSESGCPQARADGCILMRAVPAGFLKVTRVAVEKMMRAFPELIYGPISHPYFDLFHHGAHGGVWFGEDYALSRRWVNQMKEKLWLIPNLNISHWGGEKEFAGNYHEYLLRQPGGMLDPKRVVPMKSAS